MEKKKRWSVPRGMRQSLFDGFVARTKYGNPTVFVRRESGFNPHPFGISTTIKGYIGIGFINPENALSFAKRTGLCIKNCLLAEKEK